MKLRKLEGLISGLHCNTSEPQIWPNLPVRVDFKGIRGGSENKSKTAAEAP